MKNLLVAVVELFCLSLNLITLPVLAQVAPKFAEDICKAECVESQDTITEVLIPEGDGSPLKVEFSNEEVKIYAHQAEGTKAWMTELPLDSIRFSRVEGGYCVLERPYDVPPCKIHKKDIDENIVLCDTAGAALSFTAEPVYNMEVVDSGKKVQVRLYWVEVETYIKAWQPTPPPGELHVKHVGMHLPSMPQSKEVKTQCDCAKWRAESTTGHKEFTWYSVIKEEPSNIRLVPSADFQMTPTKIKK